MKNGTKIFLGVAGGLAVAGLVVVGVKLARSKPTADISSTNTRPQAQVVAPPAPPPPTPAPSPALPEWAQNVNAGLSIVNNLFSTGLGAAKQLGYV